MIKKICKGPVIGRYTIAEAKELGRPGIVGHNKRGIVKRENKLQYDDDGAVKTDDDGNPIYKVIEHVVPCGQDLTRLIDSVPANGEKHELQCPACKNVFPVLNTPPVKKPDPDSTEA